MTNKARIQAQSSKFTVNENAYIDALTEEQATVIVSYWDNQEMMPQIPSGNSYERLFAFLGLAQTDAIVPKLFAEDVEVPADSTLDSIRTDLNTLQTTVATLDTSVTTLQTSKQDAAPALDQLAGLSSISTDVTDLLSSTDYTDAKAKLGIP